MKLTTLGIIGNTLYVGPFYGGDSFHELILSKSELESFKEEGVPVYDHIDYIICQLEGMTVEEYRKLLKTTLFHQLKLRLNCHFKNKVL
jgi:hypothetical protein